MSHFSIFIYGTSETSVTMLAPFYIIYIYVIYYVLGRLSPIHILFDLKLIVDSANYDFEFIIIVNLC